jgi:hypothetical protein
MLDLDPLQPIPGTERPTDSDDPNAFVAKLRYQQTKVDGVIPTILVEQAVVSVIAEQRQWLAATHPRLQPKYLFIGVKQNLAGRRPRPYASYRDSLSKLDQLHGLTDATGTPLRFSQTHRLRHTRATELLNDGVPIHVVQRYLGHRSPEMTLRYAATLAATAEAEFLKHKKIGAHGTDIAISPSDILDMTQLSARTDRVLPNWPVIVIVYCAVALVPPLLVLALSTRRSARTRRIQRRLVRVLTRYGPISVRILFLVAGVALATDALIHHSALW